MYDDTSFNIRICSIARYYGDHQHCGVVYHLNAVLKPPNGEENLPERWFLLCDRNGVLQAIQPVYPIFNLESISFIQGLIRI